MKAAVIFDMDGTLFQTNTILEVALEQTFHTLREKGEWSGPAPLQTYQSIMGVRPLVAHLDLGRKKN